MEFHSLLLLICSLISISSAFDNSENFAFTDKVGQGNFAFSKLFAFNDGSLYRLAKRSSIENERPFAFAINGMRNKFAKHRGGQESEFAFAFAKRSPRTFAIINDPNELQEENSLNYFAKKFAKRDKTFTNFAK